MQELTKEEALTALALHKATLLQHSEECVMCALSEQRDRDLVVQGARVGTVVLDRFGSRAGHLLVIAPRHVERATELSFEEYASLQRLVYDACRALERLLQPKRVFVAALGASSPRPMTFSHFHLHVVPVLEDDERARPAQIFSWTEGVVTYEPEQARDLVRQLKSAWPVEGASPQEHQARNACSCVRST